MYNTLFPRTNASPYLFFNWPLTYSCLFFFFAERDHRDFAFGRVQERERDPHGKKRRKQRQNNTRRPSFCATSIEPVTREDTKRVVVESSVGDKARKRATPRVEKRKPTTLGFPSIAIEGRSTRSRAVGSPVHERVRASLRFAA
jgi:hypothetical protein